MSFKNKKVNFSREKFSCFPKSLKFCKRAQFFSMYLVVLTLFMCGLSIFLYVGQQDEMSNSLVSPVSILNLSDELEIFEYREGALVRRAVCDFKDRKNEDIAGEIKEEIINRIFVGGEVYDFLISDEVEDSRLMLESLYRVSKDGKVVTVERNAQKNFKLEPIGKNNENNFPVKLEWKYEKEYKINLETDC